MSSFINQSLFVRVSSLEDTLSSLEPFIYSTMNTPLQNEAIEPSTQSEMIEQLSITESPPMIPETPVPIKEATVAAAPVVSEKRRSPSLFFSDKEDTLFWAIYIHVYGYATYLDISTKYKNIELAEKQKIMIHLKANALTYKTGTTTKLTNVNIQEIMSELMTNRKTSLLTVYALCIYYKIPITLVKDYMYHEYVLSNSDTDSTDECILYYRHGRYGIYLTEVDVPTFDRTKAIRLETIYKPLRGVSTYKMDDLEQIFAKVAPTEDLSAKKWKKGDLYNAILEKLVW